MGGESELTELRRALDATDEELLRLIAERQRLAARIGRIKQTSGRGTRDFAREREVLERAADQARGLGVPSDLAQGVMKLLIRSSLTTQERDKVAAHGQGDGRRALVIGGAGKMGAWLARFLAAQGYAVSVSDPAVQDGDERHVDWRSVPLDHDVIAVAAPLVASAGILHRLAERRPPGLIFDVGSLKRPLQPGLAALARANCRVSSLHPMFGPDTELLSGRHVIFVDCGVAEATAQAKELFASTMAEQVDMALDEHDRVIAYVLGLSHALNIAFFTALADSGETAPALEQLSSTTFDRQLDIARQVAGENPHLYFEIQSLNAHGLAPVRALRDTVDTLATMIEAGNEQGFVGLMRQGLAYLEGRQSGETNDY